MDMDIFWIVTSLHLVGLIVVLGFIACIWCESESFEAEDFWNYV